ncbi:MAG: hypothetical protein ACI35Q_08310 [Marinilabiliaceae bacterium]
MQLQYLNGTAAAEPQTLFDSVQSQLLHTGADIDSVVGGFDLDDYQGLNDTADTEKLRAYILRTKKIADESPALIQSVRNPETFSQMCAYLLQYWDTAEREQAALLMAQKEKRLFESGMIRRVEGDEFGSEFFKALYLMLRPQSEIAGLCGATILRRLKGKVRASVASARRTGRDAAAAVQSTIARHKAATPSLSGADGDPMDELTLAGVVYGLEDEYHGGEENDRRYLTRLQAAIGEAPALFFPTQAEAQAVVRGLGSVLDYWDNAELRDIALSQAQNNPALTQQTSGLFGRLRKRLKKIAKGVKKAVKTVGKGVKTAATTVAKGVKTAAKAVAKITKKIGKRIARIAKKVVKFLIRFNPVTAIMRAILCLCARCNWFSLASKCYPGSLTQAEALKLGVSKEDYEKKHKPSFAKFKSVFEKIGGRESKLKSRLRTGYGRKAKGDLNTGISKSSLTKLYEEGDKDAKEEVADEKAQLKQEGAVEDSTVPAGQIVKTKVTVEVAANAITTTAAASLYETAAAKVLANIPKGTPLLYDTATNNATFYNVNYGGNNGYVKKSLCRAATDAEAQKLQTTDTTRTVTVDAPVSGLAGLGYVEPVTLSAIAASVSTVTGLVATVAKAFGKDKVAAAAETVDSATKLAQGVTDTVKQAKAGGEAAVAALKQQGAGAAGKVAAIISAGKQVADTGKQVVSAGAQAVSSLKQQGASAGSKVADVISAGRQVADTVKQTVTSAQPVSTPFTQASRADSQTAARPEPATQSSDTLTQTAAAGGQPQNTSPSTSLSVALSPAAKKYLIIGGVVLAGGLAVYALSRKK